MLRGDELVCITLTALGDASPGIQGDLESGLIVRLGRAGAACRSALVEKVTPYFFLIFIYIFSLVAPGLFCSRRAPSLQHVSSLVVACELLVAACMWDLVP